MLQNHYFYLNCRYDKIAEWVDVIVHNWSRDCHFVGQLSADTLSCPHLDHVSSWIQPTLESQSRIISWMLTTRYHMTIRWWHCHYIMWYFVIVWCDFVLIWCKNILYDAILYNMMKKYHVAIVPLYEVIKHYMMGYCHYFVVFCFYMIRITMWFCHYLMYFLLYDWISSLWH